MMMPERTGRPSEEPLLAELTYADLPSFLRDATQYFALGHLYLRTQNPEYRIGQEGACEVVLPVMNDRLRCLAQVSRRLPDGVVFTIQRWEQEHSEQLWRFVAIAWPMLRESGFEQFKGPAPTPAARLNIKSLVNRAEKAHIRKGIKQSLGGEHPPRAAADYLRAMEEISEISGIVTSPPSPTPPEPDPTPPVLDPFGSPPKKWAPPPTQNAAPRASSPPKRAPVGLKEDEESLSGIYRYDGPPIREASIPPGPPRLEDDELGGIYRMRQESTDSIYRMSQGEHAPFRFTPLQEEEDKEEDDDGGLYRYKPGIVSEYLRAGEFQGWPSMDGAPEIDSPHFDAWAEGRLDESVKITPTLDEDPLWDDDPGPFRIASKPKRGAAAFHVDADPDDGIYRYKPPSTAAERLAKEPDSRPDPDDMDDDELDDWLIQGPPLKQPTQGKGPPAVRIRPPQPKAQTQDLTPDPFNLVDLGIEPPSPDWLSDSEAPRPRETITVTRKQRAQAPRPVVRKVAAPQLRGQRWNLKERGLALVLADCLRRGVTGWVGVVAGNTALRVRMDAGAVIQIEQRPRPDPRLLSTAAAALSINQGMFTELGDLLSQEDRPEHRLMELGRIGEVMAGKLLSRRLSLQLSRMIERGWRGEAVFEPDYNGGDPLLPLKPIPTVPLPRLIYNGLRAKTDRAAGQHLESFLAEVIHEGARWNPKSPFPVDEIEPRGEEGIILAALAESGLEGIPGAIDRGADQSAVAATVWCLVQLGVLIPPEEKG